MRMFLAICFFGSPLYAGKISLLKPETLQKNYSSYRVVDARPKGSLEKLPGAVRMDWKDWTIEKPSFWNFLFGEVTQWGKIRLDGVSEDLTRLGISNQTPIAVIGSPKGWGDEGRVAWNFLFWGSETVILVDGGYPAWEKLPEKPLTPRPADRAPFLLRLETWRRAELAEVRRGERPLIDARSEEEFRGKKIRGQKRGGHLPKAQLVPVSLLYEEDGSYLSKAKLTVALGKTTEGIAYCTGGVRSALLALLVEARLGKRIANYDGSVWEWAAHKELPLISE